jgi:galactokinase
MAQPHDPGASDATLAAGDPETIADQLLERFASLYDRSADGCFAAPGRVNLIGEHVDYNGGRCLPIALHHATYAAVAARSDDRLRVTSLRQERPWTGSLAEIGPGRVEGWASYVAGVVWALREDGIDVPGLDIVVDSRVPVGAGLSSSAALECSVALGACAAAGIDDDDLDDAVRRRLVTACMRAETEVAGAPTGGMDQTVALLAEREHALLIDCEEWSVEQEPWDPAGAGLELLVVDTRAHHTLVDGGYESRRRECEQAAEQLGVPSLRRVDDADAALDRLTDPTLRRRARHVLTEMARVTGAVDQLRARDFEALGRTFDASHVSMRDDFEISCAELDAVVDAAVQHGALGARMTGGGFGGSALALVPQDRVDAVTRAVTQVFADRGWPSPGFVPAAAGPGARRLR